MNALPLGDLTIKQFLTEYWQKKPLLIRQALPECISPIAADELAGLACEEQVESRLIIHEESSEKWELSHGPFSEDTLRALPEVNWTLLVQAVDFWVPEAAKFLDQFNFIPSWRLDDLMISLSGDGGGVGPHFDNYDVFLVQVGGRRQWEVGGMYDEQSPRRSDSPLMILTDWNPEESWILEPGDMLYVPPRIGHSGIAVGNDCMTCSVGFRALSHGEIIREFGNFVAGTLGEEVRYADPDLVPQSNPGHITPEALNKVHQILRWYVEDKDRMAEWFGRTMTNQKYQEEEPALEGYTLDEIQKHIDSKAVLLRNEGSRFAYQEHGSAIWLFVDGRSYRCSERQKLLVETLCAVREIDADQFSKLDEDLSLLLDLLNHGSLYLPS